MHSNSSECYQNMPIIVAGNVSSLVAKAAEVLYAIALYVRIIRSDLVASSLRTALSIERHNE